MGDSSLLADLDQMRAADERASAAERAFASFVAGLRDADACFAAASVLHPEDMGEWQAPVYLMSGCWVVWAKLGDAVMRSRSIGPVVEELEDPTYGWSGGEREVLVWAAHFWNFYDYPAHFPYRFDGSNFARWIVACQLYKGLAPDASLLGSNE